MAKKRAQPVSYDKPLGEKAKRRAFAILVRSLSLTVKFSDYLIPTNIPQQDQVYALVWKVAVDYCREFSKLMDEQHCVEAVQEFLEEQPELLDDEQHAEMEEFLEFCFDKRLKLDDAWGQEALKRYMRHVLAEQATEALHQGDGIVAGLSQYFETQQQKVAEIESIGVDRSFEIYPVGWADKPLLVLQTTTLPIFNYLLEGGAVKGEVVGCIAPFGTCKTTLAFEMAINETLIADRLYRAGVAAGKKVPFRLIVAVSYETMLEEVRLRTLGYGAQIPRDRLAELKGRKDYSTADNMQPYERELEDYFGSIGVAGGTQCHQRCEWDRVRWLTPKVNRHLLLLNSLSLEGVGEDRIVKTAQLGISDIRLSIEARKRQLRRLGIEDIVVHVIYLDYVGLAVETMMQNNDIDSSELTKQLAAFPMKCKKQLAVPYDCPMWLFQQYRGEVQGKPPTAKLHHADAGECKSFAKNLDFCFCIGNQDENARAAVWRTKQRRAGQIPPTVLQIEGMWNRTRWRPDMMVDVNAKVIRERDEDEELGYSDDSDDEGNPSDPKTMGSV